MLDSSAAALPDARVAYVSAEARITAATTNIPIAAHPSTGSIGVQVPVGQGWVMSGLAEVTASLRKVTMAF